MNARVKESCFLPTVRSAGVIFVKSEWTAIPAWAENEVKDNPLLEIQPLDEAEKAKEEPAKLLVPKSRRGKKL